MARLFCAWFGFGLAACVALVAAPAARAGDPARDLGDIESAGSRDVDEAATARARDVEEALADEPAEAEAIEGRDAGAIAPARAGDVAPVDPKSLEEADRAPAWEPPPCEAVDAEPEVQPEASDTAGWAAALAEAQTKLERAKTQLAEADAGYSGARSRQKPRGAALRDRIAERDAARLDYARARCVLPQLVERARRAGVSAEVWRSYPASVE
jgi:hypothetical protein